MSPTLCSSIREGKPAAGRRLPPAAGGPPRPRTLQLGTLPVCLKLCDGAALAAHPDGEVITIMTPAPGRPAPVKITNAGPPRTFVVGADQCVVLGGGVHLSDSRASRTWLHLEVSAAAVSTGLGLSLPRLEARLRALLAEPVCCSDAHRQAWSLWERGSLLAEGGGSTPQEARGRQDPGLRVAAGLSIDHGVLTLIATLMLQRRLSPATCAAGTPGGLSEAALARVIEFVECRVANPIGPGDLAGLLGLPSSSFSRAFRTATGLSPYQYILSRRVAHAEALLRGSTLPLVEVADAAGFASQSHMTDVLRTRLGLTPGQIRRRGASDTPAGPARPACGVEASTARQPPLEHQ